MGRWKCPMCGKMGHQTKEHVWPKWLHQSPMAKNLLANSHGERMSYEYADLCIENGRAVAVPKMSMSPSWFRKSLLGSVPNVITVG